MSGAAPWSVKGIDPKAREVAKDLARRSGMTLGEWLNTMIMDDEDDTVTPMPRRPHIADIFERRGRSRRLDDSYEQDRYGASDETLQRVAASVDAIAARLEAAERRSTVAIQGVDQAVSGLLRRIDGQDEDAKTTARRLDDMSEELREGHRRLRKFEQDTGPHTAEIFKKMETAVGAVASRLYDMEERQRSSVNELRQRMDAVDRTDASGRFDSALTAMAGRLQDIEARQRAGAETLRGRIDAVEKAAGALKDGVGAELLAQVAARLDGAQSRTSEALRSLEQSFAGLDQRMRATEARVEPESVREAARFEKLAETLSRQVDANRSEMMRRLDTAETENRLERIERTVQSVGDSARAAEQRSAQGIEAMGREVLRIAQNLNGRVAGVEAADVERNERLNGVVSGLGSLNGRVAGIESADAERTERLTGMVSSRIETLTAQMNDKLDRDMGRYAQAVEQRLTRTDDRHAIALEKLGDEITRISDRLADRIAQSERKSAQALEDIGRRMVDSSDRIEQRYDRASGELAERMRLSEERTARLLADAADTLSQRPVRIEREAPMAASDILPDWRAAAFPDEDFPHHETRADAWSDDPLSLDMDPAPFPAQPQPSLRKPAAEAAYSASLHADINDPIDDLLDDPVAEPGQNPGKYSGQFRGMVSSIVAEEPAAPMRTDAPPPAVDVAPRAQAEPFGSAASFAGVGGAGFGGADVGDALEATATAAVQTPPIQPPVQQQALSQPASALEGGFDAGQDDYAAETDFVDARTLRQQLGAAAGAARAASTRTTLDAARATMTAQAEDAPRGGFGLSLKKGGKSRLQERLDKQAAKEGSTVRKALLASVTGMAVIGGVYATSRLSGGDGFSLPGVDGLSRALGLSPSDANTPADVTEAAPILAPALTPTDAVASASPEAQTLYDKAIADLDAGRKGGVATLTQAANLGLPSAQLKLMSLYSDGGPGVTANATEARLWARRAAEGGDPRGMHNFGMYLYDGVGGAKNRPEALSWLLKAADRGLVDSQYNVARMYDNGDDGVAANPTDALKWYLIAARAGDPDAQAAVDRLSAQIPAPGRRTARAAAAAFQVEPLA